MQDGNSKMSIHVDASQGMLPAELGLMGFETSMNHKMKRGLTPKALEVGIPFSVVNS